MKSVIVTIAFSILVIFTAFANNDNPPANTDRTITADNCFFLDPDEKIVFIDFEEINGFAKEVIVKNDNDEIIFQAQLWDEFNLNGNIYEWSYAEEATGNFTIELYTFTRVLTKEIGSSPPLASK